MIKADYLLAEDCRDCRFLPARERKQTLRKLPAHWCSKGIIGAESILCDDAHIVGHRVVKQCHLQREVTSEDLFSADDPKIGRLPPSDKLSRSERGDTRY